MMPRVHHPRAPHRVRQSWAGCNPSAARNPITCGSLLRMALIAEPQQVVDFLRAKPNSYFCDDCVCNELDLKISRRQQVKQITTTAWTVCGVRPQTRPVHVLQVPEDGDQIVRVSNRLSRNLTPYAARRPTNGSPFIDGYPRSTPHLRW
jgi:hypothetical protein